MKDYGLLREDSLQSSVDSEQLKALSEYIRRSPGEDITKFDTFPKYVQRGTLGRFLARYEIFKLQLNVVGSILDLGVSRGASLFTWAQLSAMFEPVNYTREIIGFDTFEGVAELDEKDKAEGSKLLSERGFKTEDSTYEDIQEAIKVFDINRPLNHIKKIHLVKGDAEKTLVEFLKENPHLVISLLHLDMDVYRPTRVALELLRDRIPKGGIMLFDELNTRVYPGETVAVMETVGIGNLRLKRFPWATTLSYAIVE